MLSVDIHREQHLFLLWKIQQNSKAEDEIELLSEQIVSELEEQIAIIDFELEEMREQQLCVDLSIEKYFPRLKQYPKVLRHLFD
jgi:hypothetical protein